MNAYLDAMKQYATFSGRATRSQYWLFVLSFFILVVVGSFIDVSIGSAKESEAAKSEEITYYEGELWSVILRKPADLAQDIPYCAIQTSVWSEKYISFDHFIGDHKNTEVKFTVKNEEWSLPPKRKTALIVKAESTFSEYRPEAWPEMQSISKNTLQSVPAAFTSMQSFDINRVIGAILLIKGPASLTLQFDGNEPKWNVPALSASDAVKVSNAFSECYAAIQEMGTQSHDEGSSTSPFK